MAKRDLLAEAIADAKTVKETAIANAKAALEEAFTPQLKNMLSAKLQEMEDEDEETIDETKEEIEEQEEDLNLEALLSELDDEEDGENLDESDDSEEDTIEEEESTEDEPISETDDEESDEEEDGENEEEEDEIINLEDMSAEDLTSFIEDVITNMLEDGELPIDGEEGEDMEDELEGEFEEEEVVDLEELLAEIDALEEGEDEDTIDEGLGDWIVKTVNKFGASGAVEDLIKDKLPRVVAAAKKTGKLASDFNPSEELVKALTLDAKEDGGSGDIIFKDGKIQYQSGKDTRGAAQASTFESKITELEGELEEVKEANDVLRKELNEVNLLNAKLLYTNKIFKGKNLTESQKLKVLSTFDKATNVKEVKLVYETLDGSFKTSKKPISENLGSASKVLSSTKTKSAPIIEDETFKRMVDIAFYESKH